MVHDTPYDPSVRERTEEEDEDLGLSEGENKESGEMIREHSLHRSSSAVRSLYSHRLTPPSLMARPLAVFPSKIS